MAVEKAIARLVRQSIKRRVVSLGTVDIRRHRRLVPRVVFGRGQPRRDRVRFPPGHDRSYHLMFALLIPVLLITGSFTLASAPSDPWKRRGSETLDSIRSALQIPNGNLYAEQVAIGNRPGSPARLWASSVLLSAFAAAARVQPGDYVPLLSSYAADLYAYWTEYGGIGGFAVLPAFQPVERFYDDNAWMALALAEAFQVTGDYRFLRWAEDALRFVLSGEDGRLGGGVYWHEQERTTKNTSSTAPGALAALRLHQITGEPRYHQIGYRLYNWVRANLHDVDGLFSDHVRLDGRVDTTKWSYNTGVMISANSALYAIRKDTTYLERARQLAKASERRWVRPATGAVADEGQFAVLLMEGLLSVFDHDRDPHWVDVAHRALGFLYDSARDPNGFYGRYWDKAPAIPQNTIRLMPPAAAARGYFVASRYLDD